MCSGGRDKVCGGDAPHREGPRPPGGAPRGLDASSGGPLSPDGVGDIPRAHVAARHWGRGGGGGGAPGRPARGLPGRGSGPASIVCLGCDRPKPLKGCLGPHRVSLLGWVTEEGFWYPGWANRPLPVPSVGRCSWGPYPVPIGVSIVFWGALGRPLRAVASKRSSLGIGTRFKETSTMSKIGEGPGSQ